MGTIATASSLSRIPRLRRVWEPNDNVVLFGHYSREFAVDAPDYIDSGSLAQFGAGSTSWTLSLWCKRLGGSGGAERACEISNGALGIGYYSNSWRCNIGNNWLITTSVTDDGGWYHLSLVGDGTNIIFYVDGIEKYSAVTSYSLTSAYTMRIGNSSAGNGGPYTGANALYGRIADARIYNAALSSTNVASLIAGESLEADLVFWSLIDSDDVLDYSGNGNHGTNNGSTYSPDGPLD